MTDNLYLVLPLAGNDKAKYCPPKGSNGAYSYYPATKFLQRLVNPNIWTLDYEIIKFSTAWLNALESWMGTLSYNYWRHPSDGQWFPAKNPDKLLLCVFPGNVIQINDIVHKPVRGSGWWGKVSTLTYTATPPDLSTLPAYLWSNQSDENFMGQVLPSIDDTGHNVRFPLVSNHDVWIDMSCVDAYIPPTSGPQPDLISNVKLSFDDGSEQIVGTHADRVEQIVITRDSGQQTIIH